MNLPALVDQYGSPLVATEKAHSAPLDGPNAWYPLIREPFTGAWQRNISVNAETAATHVTDFACKTQIAGDISKLGVLLKKQDGDDPAIWSETTNPAYSPVLREPNHYQTANQFWENWILSKLSYGNTYVLKRRDMRNVVTDLYILDPSRVIPLEAEDGSVFYRLFSDKLSGVPYDVVIPAREIIHDRFNCLYHRLCGLPPVFASGLASMQALNIQKQAVWLFENNSQPGGILTSPGRIDTKDAESMKTQWEQNFGGRNRGRVVVLGGGLQYQRLVLTSAETQMIEQLNWTGRQVAAAYHVPEYMVGVGEMPTNTSIQALKVDYYTRCLQKLLEDAEAVFDAGLGIGRAYGIRVEFDVDNLLRMDSLAQMQTIEAGVRATVLAPNDGRRMVGLGPKKGGDSPLVQHQMYSLEDIARRSAMPNPFHPELDPTSAPAAPDPAPPEPAAKEIDPEITKMAIAGRTHRAVVSLQKHLDRLMAA